MAEKDHTYRFDRVLVEDDLNHFKRLGWFETKEGGVLAHCDTSAEINFDEDATYLNTNREFTTPVKDAIDYLGENEPKAPGNGIAPDTSNLADQNGMISYHDLTSLEPEEIDQDQEYFLMK